VYFTISGGDDHYQLQIGKLELETAETAASGSWLGRMAGVLHARSRR